LRTRFTRREFLQITGAGIAVATLPACGGSSPRSTTSAASARFFTEHEYATIDAAVARLIPDDTNPDGSPSPGAGPARVVDYIDRLLAAFDGDEPPFIFAGGPASDRNPEPDPRLCNASVPPNGPGPNDFATPVALSRRQEISWKAQILGTKALGQEGDFLRANNKALGSGDENGDVPGLQEIYRQGVADLDSFANQLFGSDFVALSGPQQDVVLNLNSNQGFVGTLFSHTVEGMYANPEYGGNQPPDRTRPATGADGDNRPVGWSYVGFEGDRQPLGYTVFDPVTESYCEFPDHPMSGANPGADGGQLGAPMIAQLPALIAGLQMRR
jgi:Gluconate 2-dehydrogenase subunit 3